MVATGAAPLTGVNGSTTLPLPPLTVRKVLLTSRRVTAQGAPVTKPLPSSATGASSKYTCSMASTSCPARATTSV